VIRQDHAPDTTLRISGCTVSSDIVIPIGTLQPGTPQDNAVGIPLPASMTLAQSGLIQSGAFTGTPVISGTTGDRLMIFNNNIQGINKCASRIFYYYTGDAFGGPGWREKGKPIVSIMNDEMVFGPSVAILIRKQAESEPQTVFWKIPHIEAVSVPVGVK
jgi:uncharacterized protein (TIGR02597 family)